MMCPNFIYWILEVLKVPKVSKSLINQGLLARLFDSNCNAGGHTILVNRKNYKFIIINATKARATPITADTFSFSLKNTVAIKVESMSDPPWLRG